MPVTRVSLASHHCRPHLHLLGLQLHSVHRKFHKKRLRRID